MSEGYAVRSQRPRLRRRRRRLTAAGRTHCTFRTATDAPMYTTASSLRIANLTNLLWVRRECLMAHGAATLFALDSDAVACYVALADSAIEALCGELDVSLLIPRFDAGALLSMAATIVQHPPIRARTGLELNNLRNLHDLRQACERSSAEALWTYRISQETATAYRALDDAAVLALCGHLTVSAFVPRYAAAQLTRILDKPAGSRAVFAAAYEPDIAEANHAARRSIYLAH